MSGYIGARPAASDIGVFTVNQQYEINIRGDWGSDPFWNSVVLLLQPSSGESVITDKSLSAHSVTNNGVTIDGTNEKWPGEPSMKSQSSNSDYLTLPNSSDFLFGTDDVTIECFAYSTSGDGTTARILGMFDSTSDFYIFTKDDANGLTNYAFRARNGGTDFVKINDDNVITAENTWQHVAFTREGNDARLFVDGTLVASTTTTTAFPSLTANLNVFMGGQNSNYWDGNLTSIRITKGVARYTGAFTPPADPFPTF